MSATSRYSPLLGSTQTTWSNGMSATSRYSPLMGSTQTTWSNGMSATSRLQPASGLHPDDVVERDERHVSVQPAPGLHPDDVLGLRLRRLNQVALPQLLRPPASQRGALVVSIRKPAGYRSSHSRQDVVGRSALRSGQRAGGRAAAAGSSQPNCRRSPENAVQSARKADPRRGYSTTTPNGRQDALDRHRALPECATALTDESHPCRRVVAAQLPGLPRSRHQLPEPWNGRIESAPILFVGSNPSFDRSEKFPTKGWADHTIEAFFTTRFDPTYSKCSLLERRALDRTCDPWQEPRPGYDFALTEVVRCKSRNEEGAPGALATCTELYLGRTFQVAGAKVVIALGRVAREGIASYVGGTSEIGLRRRMFDIGGRERAVLMLGHPSSAQRQTPTEAEVTRLRLKER